MRGLSLEGHKRRSLQHSIVDVPAPPTLIFSIDASADLNVCVQPGDAVLLGQLLAYSPRTRKHASVSGRVRTVERTARGIAIVVDNDTRDRPHTTVIPIALEHIANDALRARIRDAGIVGLGGAAFPTAIKLDAAAGRVETLILNGAECEPYIACDEALMREQASEILLGAQALLHATGASRAIIAIEHDKPEAIAAMQVALAAAQDQRLQLRTLPSYYPAGGERQLISLLTGREVPSRGLPQDIGMLCHNVGTATAVARLVRTGEPLIERIVTVTGSAIDRPRNVRARIGTPIATLLDACNFDRTHCERLILGGTMMGVALEDDSITVSAATNCIVAATRDDLALRGPELPCIRCGNCSDICPAFLLPQQLYRAARNHDHSALAEFGLRDCIECGCCDYVCPSQIPLTSTFRAAKSPAPGA